MIKYLLIPFLFVISTAAAAQNSPQWAVTGSGNNGKEMNFIDVGSAYEIGGNMRAWTSAIFEEPRDVKNQPVYAEKVLMEYDCREQRSKALKYIVYNRSGTIVSAWESGSAWSFILPGSIGDGFLRTVCGREEPRKLAADFDPVKELNIVLEIMKK